jgi:putative Mn2+ efflux pump MntP
MNSSPRLLALAMSTDAFAAAVRQGRGLHRPHWREALRAGLIFGAIEALHADRRLVLGSLASELHRGLGPLDRVRLARRARRGR